MSRRLQVDHVSGRGDHESELVGETPEHVDDLLSCRWGGRSRFIDRGPPVDPMDGDVQLRGIAAAARRVSRMDMAEPTTAEMCWRSPAP